MTSMALAMAFRSHLLVKKRKLCSPPPHTRSCSPRCRTVGPLHSCRTKAETAAYQMLLMFTPSCLAVSNIIPAACVLAHAMSSLMHCVGWIHKQTKKTHTSTHCQPSDTRQGRRRGEGRCRTYDCSFYITELILLCLSTTNPSSVKASIQDYLCLVFPPDSSLDC